MTTDCGSFLNYILHFNVDFEDNFLKNVESVESCNFLKACKHVDYDDCKYEDCEGTKGPNECNKYISSTLEYYESFSEGSEYPCRASDDVKEYSTLQDFFEYKGASKVFIYIFFYFGAYFAFLGVIFTLVGLCQKVDPKPIIMVPGKYNKNNVSQINDEERLKQQQREAMEKDMERLQMKEQPAKNYGTQMDKPTRNYY